MLGARLARTVLIRRCVSTVDIGSTRVSGYARSRSMMVGAGNMSVEQTGLNARGRRTSPLGNGRYPLVCKTFGPTLPDCADGVSIDAYVGYQNNAPLGAQIVRKLCAE